MTQIALAEHFEVGQIWNYKTREVEPESTLIILRIEDIQNQCIIHIQIQDLRIINPRVPNGYTNLVSHAPCSKESIKASVTTYVGRAEKLPDFEEGYKLWKEAFESGKAGWFTTNIGEVVQFMEDALNQ